MRIILVLPARSPHPPTGHGLFEQLAVFGNVDGVERGAAQLHAMCIQNRLAMDLAVFKPVCP
jgi:hypothetical protein